LGLTQKNFHFHRDRRRSLSNRVRKSASFTKDGELPDRETFSFSKINLLHGVISILQNVPESSVMRK